MNALDKQVGGNHYKKFKIQPAEFCHINQIPYLEATAIKYLCRWRDKGGFDDLDKAIHFIELLKELEGKYNANIRLLGGSGTTVGNSEGHPTERKFFGSDVQANVRDRGTI